MSSQTLRTGAALALLFVGASLASAAPLADHLRHALLAKHAMTSEVNRVESLTRRFSPPRVSAGSLPSFIARDLGAAQKEEQRTGQDQRHRRDPAALATCVPLAQRPAALKWRKWNRRTGQFC